MLKRVSIQNFKSLKDVTLDLQKVNLLIGQNNSGKTNFLNGLIAYDSLNENSCRLFSFNRNNKQINFIFQASLSVGEFSLEKHYETLPFKDELSFWLNNHDSDDITEKDQRLQTLAYHNFTSIFIDAKVYSLQPDKLKNIYPILPDNEYLREDVSNLIPFLEILRDKYRANYKSIESDLSKCLPEFDYISFDTVEVAKDNYLREAYGDKTYKKIGLHHRVSGVSFWADELSEGTLYFMALLCIINQPNPPKLLLLEEPEKGIHPRRIFEVIQFILRLVEEKDVQVIMTTHSPIVVDMFKDMPESVFIFDKDEEGATHVKNLQRDVIEPETAKSEELGLDPPHYTDSLGDAWTVGFLGGVPK